MKTLESNIYTIAVNVGCAEAIADLFGDDYHNYIEDMGDDIWDFNIKHL